MQLLFFCRILGAFMNDINWPLDRCRRIVAPRVFVAGETEGRVTAGRGS